MNFLEVYYFLQITIWLNSFCRARTIQLHAPFQRRRVLLTFHKDNQSNLETAECLIRENSFGVQDVKTTHCSDIPVSDALRAAWIWFPDGRIRGTNGLCLIYAGDLSKNRSAFKPQSSLIASRCVERNNATAEIWALKNERLWNEALTKDLTDVLSLDTELPVWQIARVELESFDVTKLADLQQQKLKLSLENQRNRFQQLKRQMPNVPRDLAELTTAVQVSSDEANQVNTHLKEIQEIVEEIKTDLHGRPTHIGEGVAVEVMESVTSESPSITFLSPKFELSAEKLRAAGVNPTGPVTVRISGYAIVPKNGTYTFIISDLTSQFKLVVNGVTVVNQWAAPALGSIKSHPPLELNAGEEIQLIASTSGILGTPNFKLKWQTSDSNPPEEIETSSLYPSIVQPLCTAGGLIMKIDCSVTFNKIRVGSEPVKVQCPPGCLSRKPKPKIYGRPGCYALHSSVCVAAIHSAVSGERGGSFLIQIDPDIKKSQYTGVEGFLVTSSDAPAAKGCGSVAMVLTEGGPIGLYEPSIMSVQDLSLSESSDELSGMYGYITSADKAIVAKKGFGPGFITEASLACGYDDSSTENKMYDLNLDFIDGAKILLKTSTKPTGHALSNLYVSLSSPSTTPMLPLTNGWNRLTCQTVKHSFALYYQHQQTTDEFQFPSTTLTCEDTFSSLPSPLPSFTVRCPRFCFKSFAPVLGLFTYSERSSVCRSGLHAGVIADAGGVIDVKRLFVKESVTWSGLRNGISSGTDKESGPLYAVASPSGRKCIYPQHPGGLSHLPMNSPKFEATPAFKQIVPTKRHDTLYDEEIQFKQLMGNENVFDVSTFFKGKTEGITDIKNKLNEIAEDQFSKGIEMEKAYRGVNMLQSLIKKKFEDTETRIIELETELLEFFPENAPEFTDYDRTDHIQDDWLVVDSLDAALGPSVWSFDLLQTTERRGIKQASSIVSKTGIGSALILKGKTFDKGFITARLFIPDTGYGQFGLIVKYLSDKEYLTLEITKPSTGGKSTLGFRRMRGGIFKPSEGDVSFDLPSSWIQIAIDFGNENIRAFINGGEIKTGIHLDEPQKGGTVGLFCNALATKTAIVFDSIIVGPLSSQESLAPKGAFGTEEERKNQIHLSLQSNTQAKIEEPYPIIENTASPILTESNGIKSLTTLPVTVTQTVGVDNCLKTFYDPLATGLHEGWILPEDGALWTSVSNSETRCLLGSFLQTNTQPTMSPLYLTNKCCNEGRGIEMEVSIRGKAESKGGLILRAKSSTDYYSVLLDLTTITGPQIILSDVRQGTGKEFATGTGKQLRPNSWYRLRIDDESTMLRVLLDGDVVLQSKVPVDTGNGNNGLAILTGQIEFRNFNLTLKI